eukprot:315781-Chlamydomonas_euryale.AAC.4
MRLVGGPVTSIGIVLLAGRAGDCIGGRARAVHCGKSQGSTSEREPGQYNARRARAEHVWLRLALAATASMLSCENKNNVWVGGWVSGWMDGGCRVTCLSHERFALTCVTPRGQSAGSS